MHAKLDFTNSQLVHWRLPLTSAANDALYALCSVQVQRLQRNFSEVRLKCNCRVPLVQVCSAFIAGVHLIVMQCNALQLRNWRETQCSAVQLCSICIASVCMQSVKRVMLVGVQLQALLIYILINTICTSSSSKKGEETKCKFCIVKRRWFIGDQLCKTIALSNEASHRRSVM